MTFATFQNMALGNIISRMSAKRAELHSEADQAARLAKELRAIELQMHRIEHALIAAFMDRYGLNPTDVDVQDKTGAT